jgi:hypothetical protein
VAVLVGVPWSEANRQHSVVLSLLTEDGQPAIPVLKAPPGGVIPPGLTLPPMPPLRLEGTFEVGRPPGTKEGSSLPATFAFRVPMLPLSPGGYEFQLSIDNNTVASASFDAEGPGGQP